MFNIVGISTHNWCNFFCTHPLISQFFGGSNVWLYFFETYWWFFELLDSLRLWIKKSCLNLFFYYTYFYYFYFYSLNLIYFLLLFLSAYKKALQCFNGFTGRCHPEKTEARKFIEQMSALLEQCDNPQIRQDVIAALDCGRRMGAVHERCIRETRFIPQLKDLSSERMLRGDENSIRDLCW